MSATKLQQKKGFTLIELLISIMLIIILTGATLVVLNPAKIKGRARDGQRIADMKTIQTALEQYYLKKRAYPASNSGFWFYLNGVSDNLFTALVNTPATKVLDRLPVDPLLSLTGSYYGSPCIDITNYRYNYIAPPRVSGSPNADKYILTAIMEIPNTNDGNECGALTNWTTNFSVNITCLGAVEGANPICPGNSLSGNQASFGTCNYCYGVENK